MFEIYLVGKLFPFHDHEAALTMQPIKISQINRNLEKKYRKREFFNERNSNVRMDKEKPDVRNLRIIKFCI